MNPATPPAPADRLALIIEGLCLAVARRVGLGGLAGPFIILIWSRLRRITTRFAARIACDAWTPFPIPSGLQTVIATAAKPSRRRPPSASSPLPRHRAWLLRLVPETASGASQLRHFLADPDVVSLLADAPQLRRILRPLCHMLGIRAAQALPPLAQSPLQQAGAPPDTPPIPCHTPPPATVAFPPGTTLPSSPDAPSKTFALRALV